MKCWQSFQMLRLLSLARVLLCAGFSSHLQLKCLLWRIPCLTPGKTLMSGLWAAAFQWTLGSRFQLQVLARHTDWDVAGMQVERHTRHL